MKISFVIFSLFFIHSCTSTNTNEENSLSNPPSNLTGVIQSGQVILNWNDNSNNEIGFIIERKVDSGSFQVVYTTIENTTEFTENVVLNHVYKYRVLSFNDIGNSVYSNEITLDGIVNPIPSTLNFIGVTTNKSNYVAQILNTSGVNIIAKGIVWDTNLNPDVSLTTKTTESSLINSNGFFEGSIPSLLTPSSTYHTRIYITTDHGTFYSPDFILNTTTSISDIDGNVYETVLIGDRLWTTKNLNVSRYSDGTPIQQVENVTELSNMSIGAWCYMDNYTPYGPVNGKLYNWYAAVGIYDSASYNNPALRKSIAPNGYHVPTLAEWNNIKNIVGPNAGGMMKSTGNLTQGTGLWKYPNTGATNTINFSAFPAGNRDGAPSYNFTDPMIFSRYAAFMLTTEEPSGSNSINFSWKGILSFDNVNIIGCCATPKEEFYSIRCISN